MNSNINSSAFENIGLSSTFRKFNFLKVSLAIVLMVFCQESFGATYYSIASGNWSSNTTWSTSTGGGAVGSGVYPGSGDVVYIERGYTVTIDISSAACTSLTIGRNTTGGGGTQTGFLTFSGTGSPSLAVSGTVQIGGNNSNTSSGTITFVSGSSKKWQYWFYCIYLESCCR